jgi:hypothetical protein
LVAEFGKPNIRIDFENTKKGRGTKGTVLFVPLFLGELLGYHHIGAQKEPSPLCPK